MSRRADDYTTTLFDDDRMKLRTDIFLRLALPIYQSWAERFAYRHVVHISSDLPEKWRAQLDDAAVRYPCLIINEVTEKITPATVMRDDLIKHADADMVVRLRVDDDDLLATDYLDHLDHYVRPDNVGMAVSFGLGVAAIYHHGQHSEFRLKREVLPSAGQAYIGRFDQDAQSIRGIKIHAHNRIDTFKPVIFDSREPMYLQTYHEQQDKEFGRADDPLARVRHFPEFDDHDMLAAKFPTLPVNSFDARVRAQIERSANEALARIDARWPSLTTVARSR
jgi:hypothetical protein